MLVHDAVCGQTIFCFLNASGAGYVDSEAYKLACSMTRGRPVTYLSMSLGMHSPYDHPELHVLNRLQKRSAVMDWTVQRTKLLTQQETSPTHRALTTSVSHTYSI